MSYTYESTERIEALKGRSNRCVCKYCGGSLKVKSIVFNELIDARIELFCSKCNRIEYGIEPEVYQSAKYFVEELDYNCFPDLDKNETTKQMSIAKVGEIMNWVLKNLGVIDDHGFKVEIEMDENIVGESLLLTDDDLD